jgi:hypothetical protein
MRVENCSVPLGPACRCGSWLAHWHAYRQPPDAQPLAGVATRQGDSCAVVGCTRDAEVGSHVGPTAALIRRRLVVPMCAAHAAAVGAVLEIPDSCPVALASEAQTCL